MVNKENTVQRSYFFDIRAASEESGSYIEGRPIIYESKTDIGYFDEIIQRGALEEADLKDVPFLVNHDGMMVPLARSRNNNKNSTMQLMVDDDGLLIRAYLDVENNADSKKLYSAVKRGDIDGMSFLFSIAHDEWDDMDTEHPTRTVKEIGKVYEVSAVTFPAYQDTEITARDKTALESARSVLESARSQAESLDSDVALELAKEKNKNILI